MHKRPVPSDSKWVPRLALLVLVMAGVAIEVDGAAADPVVAGSAEASPRELRQAALARRRRIIFNDDTYESSRADADTADGFLRRRLQPLVGTPVDTLSFSVLGGWGDAPIYDSRVQPVFGAAHGGPPNAWSPHTARNVKAHIDRGRDLLQVVIDFGHTHKMEVFASIRMNDSHDSFVPRLVTLWKKSHPQLLVDRSGIPPNKDAHPLGLYVIAQDFRHPEVRRRKWEIIEEVVRRYDVDGVDLNFIRHPVFFSSTMRGMPASAAETEVMTNLLRRIRRITDRRAAERGRPLLLAAVVPDNPQLARRIGLDVEAWLAGDLIDIVIPGLGYAPFSLPVGRWSEMAHRYGAKVYPCINRKAPQRIAEAHVGDGFRGVAANWYRAGADGLFFWNLGTPLEGKEGADLVATRKRYYGALPDLGDANSLVAKNKVFGIDDPVLSYYRHVTSTPRLPRVVSGGETTRVLLMVADDLREAAEKRLLESLTLELTFDQMPRGDLVVHLNDRQLGERHSDRTEKRRIAFRVPAAGLRQGSNTIGLRLATGNSKSDLALTRLRLWVRYAAR